MSGIVQNNILRTSGSIAVAAAGLNWSSTILTALTTFTVTVGNPGAGNRYYIDTVLQATVNLLEGFTYKFDQSDSSNSGHPLRFSTTSGGSHSGGSEYTTGVTTSGTPGSSGAYTQIVVASGAPVLYYYCTAHSGMGGTANTTAETVEAGNGYWIDTTSTTCTITLPSAAEKGDQIVLIDYARTWGTNAITIDSNGLNYQGDPDTSTVEYTTSGQSINIVYSDATKGWIPLEDDVTALGPVAVPSGRGIFAYGQNLSGRVSMSNLLSTSGVIASDVTGVGTARNQLSAATFGINRAIFAYGYTASAKTSISNLVGVNGVIASDTTGVGTASQARAAAGYGVGLAIFAFGEDSGLSNKRNLVSNVGVVATDATGAGTARPQLAATSYGGDKAVFAFGKDPPMNASNKVSNTGVVASDTTGVGTARRLLMGVGYGDGKGIFAFGYDDSTPIVSMSNLVSDTGVVASDVSGVGTARSAGAASVYSVDQNVAAFAYGGIGGDDTNSSLKNLVNSSGVVQANVTGVGTPRTNLAAAGF